MFEEISIICKNGHELCQHHRLWCPGSSKPNSMILLRQIQEHSAIKDQLHVPTKRDTMACKYFSIVTILCFNDFSLILPSNGLSSMSYA